MGSLESLIGESPGIAAVQSQAQRLLTIVASARRIAPILLLGETGTGKGDR